MTLRTDGSDFVDYYTLLGVEADCAEHELRTVCSVQLRKWNGRANTSPDLTTRQRAEKQVALLNAARHHLLDAARRRAYDQLRSQHLAALPAPAQAERDEDLPPVVAPPTPVPAPTPAPPPPAPAPEAEADTGTDHGEAPAQEGRPRRIRITPRFHRFRLLTGLAALVCLGAAVYLWRTWPGTTLPRVAFGAVAAGALVLPMTARRPELKARVWPVMVPAVAFAGPLGYLVYQASSAQRPQVAATVGGLVAGYAATLLCGRLAGRARQLDWLVDKDSIEHEIFNNPGSGLASGAEQALARKSADVVQRLAQLSATRIVHALVTPAAPGPGPSVAYRVDHAVLRHRRLAIVMARHWPSGHYAWGQFGALTWNGQHFDGGETGIAQAVDAFRSVVPRSVQVRGFVMLHPVDAGAYTFDATRPDGPAAGGEDQVCEEIRAWLGQDDPVVDRRVFAALLPYIQHGT